MKTSLLHDSTRHAIDRLIERKVHAVLLLGDMGMGAEVLSHTVAARALGITVESVAAHPYVMIVTPDGASITIEQIREVQRFLSLKTTGRSAQRRALILHQADLMTTQAQNALLKTLEEPPLDTIIVLDASNPETLLQTILSRVQTVQIVPPRQEDAIAHFVAQGFEPDRIRGAFILSGGAPELMLAILSDDKSHPIYADIDMAKQILSMSRYERLCQIDGLTKQKDDAVRLLAALQKICSGALRSAIDKDQSGASGRGWLGRLGLVVSAREAQRRNANLKLILTDLFLSL